MQESLKLSPTQKLKAIMSVVLLGEQVFILDREYPLYTKNNEKDRIYTMGEDGEILKLVNPIKGFSIIEA